MHAEHTRMMRGMAGAGPTMPGQDAFGAIAVIVRILEADPAMHSVVRQTPIAGGLTMEISGSGRTEQAIRAMVVPHAAELDRMPEWSATTVIIPGGVRLTVVAKQTDDTKLLARIRGLGFAGLMTRGAHHQPHHLAMAKGEALTGHGH
jgi:hypothetical protein